MDSEQKAFIISMCVGVVVLLILVLSCYHFYCRPFTNITIEPYNPQILIMDNGLMAYQIQTVQDNCLLCNEKYGNEELEILEYNHIYHKKCLKIDMKCIRCQKGENQVPIQIIV